MGFVFVYTHTCIHPLTYLLLSTLTSPCVSRRGIGKENVSACMCMCVHTQNTQCVPGTWLDHRVVNKASCSYRQERVAMPGTLQAVGR